MYISPSSFRSFLTRRLILINFPFYCPTPIFGHPGLLMCLRSKLLHPPIVPPLLFSLLTPFYLFSFFAVSSKKNQMLNSNKSSFRIDNLSPAHLGGQTSQQWGKARPPVFIPPMFHQENYFLGPISPFLENLSLFIKRVTLALKAFNRHHFNGLSAFSQA